MKKISLMLLGLFLTATSFLSPQGFMFPLFIFSYLFRNTIKKLTDRLPLWLAFIGSGLFFGLAIETFAIFNNLSRPPVERILLHPTPAIDILIALFWYGLFIGTWYLLVRKISFAKKAVYILSALFGLATEAGGALILGIISSPVLGTLTALIQTAAYGIAPFVAYMLTEERFSKERVMPTVKHYAIALSLLFVYWGIMGLLIYDPLIRLFPKPL